MTLQTRTETRSLTSATIYVDFAPRCAYCNRPLAVQATRPWVIQCSRIECKKLNYSAEETQ